MAKYEKFMLTIAKPIKCGYDHDRIKSKLSDMDIVDYWCMCDDISPEGIHHTHLLIVLAFPISGSYIMKMFPVAHIEYNLGSLKECMDYIRKSGIYESYACENGEINLPDTYEDINSYRKEMGVFIWIIKKIMYRFAMLRKKK